MSEDDLEEVGFGDDEIYQKYKKSQSEYSGLIILALIVVCIGGYMYFVGFSQKSTQKVHDPLQGVSFKPFKGEEQEQEKDNEAVQVQSMIRKD